MTELEAMRRALFLARRGWGRVHPNPMVGAVVLAQGEIAGEGFHAEYGGEHAERAALAAAGERARGATLVATLEPCGHTGKQPPCVEAILAAGIRRVVAAAADPNPEAGGGAGRLRTAGVDVELGLLEREARLQNAAFFHRHRTPSRPWVALKLATSLDCRIADRAGRSKWISGPAARGFVQALRAGFDAIAVGGRTALLDDPALTVRGPITPRVPPRRVLFEGGTPLPETLTVVRTARDVATLVVTPHAAAAGTAARLGPRGVEVIEAGTPGQALAALRRAGIASLLVEGGGRLAGSLLREGLVDRFYWIQSPLWLGEAGVPAVSGWELAGFDEAERWSAVERRGLGEDTLLVLDREPCSPAS